MTVLDAGLLRRNLARPVRASAHPAAKFDRHIPALDGVRGLAVLLVILYHAGGQVAVKFNNVREAGMVNRAIFAIFDRGWLGVDLFFVLSGFLITGILLRERGQPHYFRNFYARRTLRIFPLYYGVLIGAFFIVPIFRPYTSGGMISAERHQAFLWLYCNNFATGLRGISFGRFGHFWSLAIEEQFYLVWPALVLLCRPRAMKWMCSALVLVALVSRIFFVAIGNEPATDRLTFCQIDALAIGALLAIVMQTREIKPHELSIAAICAAIALVMLLPTTSLIWHRAIVVARPMFVSIAFAGLLVISMKRGKSFNQVFSHASLRSLGRYSYAMYVFHVPLIPALYFALQRMHILQSPQVVVAIVFAAASIGASFLIAMLSWHAYEKHFLKLKRFFREQPATA